MNTQDNKTIPNKAQELQNCAAETESMFSIATDCKADPDWHSKTVAMALCQEHSPIPIHLKADGGTVPSRFGDAQLYAIGNKAWEDNICKEMIGIRLDDLVLLDLDLYKENAIPRSEVLAIVGGEPLLVQENEEGNSPHYLSRIPKGYDRSTLKNSRIGWMPGVDLLTGNQLMYLKNHKIIIGGELPARDDIPDTPKAILEALTKPKPKNVEARTNSPASKTKAAEIISYISPDVGYKDWLAVGMGVHAEFSGGKVGLDVWAEWSSDGKDYPGREVLEYKWGTFKAGGPTTFASVCDMARKAGADLSEISKMYSKREFVGESKDFNADCKINTDDDIGHLAPTFEVLQQRAIDTTVDSPPLAVELIAKNCAHLTSFEASSIQNLLKKNTKTPIGVLRSAMSAAKREVLTMNIDNEVKPKVEPMFKGLFPDRIETEAGTKLLGTMDNMEAIMEHYQVEAYYDVIKKESTFIIPGASGSLDNKSNSAITALISLANLNELPSNQVLNYINLIADKNQRNPAADYIKREEWDGVSRLQEICDTVQVADDYPIELRDTLIKKWLLSATAAALKPAGFASRGVLTFQGDQGIGKTSWLTKLIDDPHLRSELIKTDHVLNPSDKDSKFTAISHWLVELGELDSTFKNDIAKIKGWITAPKDIMRRPYAPGESSYQRRTVCFASVNDSDFLVDHTGNTRFWTIAAQTINYQHDLNVVQLWAELAVLFESGEQWWLTPKEEEMLKGVNSEHMADSPIKELITSSLNMNIPRDEWVKVNASQLLRRLGIAQPRNGQSKEAGAVLRDLLGKPGKTKGLNTWMVPPEYSRSFPPNNFPTTDDF